MASNDYAVIVYYILSYLYHCLKAGASVELETLELKKYPAMATISESYMHYIYLHLVADGYITGPQVGEVPVLNGKSVKVIRCLDRAEITPAGIEYLETNSTMKRALSVIKEAGGLLFAAISAFK